MRRRRGTITGLLMTQLNCRFWMLLEILQSVQNALNFDPFRALQLDQGTGLSHAVRTDSCNSPK